MADDAPPLPHATDAFAVEAESPLRSEKRERDVESPPWCKFELVVVEDTTLAIPEHLSGSSFLLDRPEGGTPTRSKSSRVRDKTPGGENMPTEKNKCIVIGLRGDVPGFSSPGRQDEEAYDADDWAGRQMRLCRALGICPYINCPVLAATSPKTSSCMTEQNTKQLVWFFARRPTAMPTANRSCPSTSPTGTSSASPSRRRCARRRRNGRTRDCCASLRAHRGELRTPPRARLHPGAGLHEEGIPVAGPLSRRRVRGGGTRLPRLTPPLEPRGPFEKKMHRFLSHTLGASQV